MDQRKILTSSSQIMRKRIVSDDGVVKSESRTMDTKLDLQKKKGAEMSPSKKVVIREENNEIIDYSDGEDEVITVRSKKLSPPSTNSMNSSNAASQLAKMVKTSVKKEKEKEKQKQEDEQVKKVKKSFDLVPAVSEPEAESFLANNATNVSKVRKSPERKRSPRITKKSPLIKQLYADEQKTGDKKSSKKEEKEVEITKKQLTDMINNVSSYLSPRKNTTSPRKK